MQRIEYSDITSRLVIAGIIMLAAYFWLEGSATLIFGPMMERYVPRFIKLALMVVRTSLAVLSIVAIATSTYFAVRKLPLRGAFDPIQVALVVCLLAHAIVVWAFRDHGFFGVLEIP